MGWASDDVDSVQTWPSLFSYSVAECSVKSVFQSFDRVLC